MVNVQMIYSRSRLRHIGFCAMIAMLSIDVGLTHADASPIRLFAPTDGGTPRDPGRIQAMGPGEFRILASVEEGRSVLTHAVSRVDLVCRNEGDETRTVTLHLDLSGDGRRTNLDNNPFGGMPARDYVYIQPAGQPWGRIDGSVSGWVCTVRFPAPPGETKVGLSPWYTYGDYLHLVQMLPDHPHLKKTLLGASDGEREHWELTVTDPNAPAENKRTVFWHAREHAYETFSSYAMEGLLTYLLSDAASEARRRYQIVLHPMTNIDGVALGYEYRGGYDFPEPRGTATARLTFDAVDRLKPDFAVTWHNWGAPRDVDCLFYTDGEAGKASRRAWDLFMQRFPSPRGVDHRWENEGNPLAKNWFGRSPLNESNVHQYAMKRYGTQVWGWEMPWWGRDEGDPARHARKAGEDFGRAFIATLDAIEAGAATDVSEQPMVTVPRWEMHEFELHGRSHVDNPFHDAALIGEFTSPSGKALTVEGFHDGGDTWRLRFTPDEEGEWRYLLRGEGVELLCRGRLQCVKSENHGFIRIHPDNPYAFAHADGVPFFPMGDTCYGLYDDSPITPELRREYLETRRRQRFNFVRMSIGHSYERAQREPTYWAWGGSPERPDLDRFNPAFFRGFDDLLRQMQRNGMNAELLLLNLYRLPFTDPRQWTPARERQWLRYIVARYAAFPNLFLWTVSNEYETHPDGQYRLDQPEDVQWARATARFVKQLDPYGHPVTVHPVVSASTKGASPRDPYESPWRIGEFFGEGDDIDVLSHQTGQHGEGTAWDETLQCWTGDSVELATSLRADRRYRKPVLNTENGYEYLRGRSTERKQVHHTDKVRRSAWRIVCGGGYFAAGFHGTIGHSDIWNRMDAPNQYTFVIAGEGAAEQLGILYDYFTSLPFWRMQPFDGATGELAVALTEPGQVYVVYLPHGGPTTVDLSSASGQFAVQWFDPRTGAVADGKPAQGGSRNSFESPGEGDWVLRLQHVPSTREGMIHPEHGN